MIEKGNVNLYKNDILSRFINGEITIDKTEFTKCRIIKNWKMEYKTDPYGCSNLVERLNKQDYDLKYIAQGVGGIVHMISKKNISIEKFSIAMKIILDDRFYLKDGENNDDKFILSPDIEAIINTLFHKKLLLNKITPHLLYILDTFDCDGLTKISEGYESRKFAELTSNFLKDNNVANRTKVILSEFVLVGTLKKLLSADFALGCSKDELELLYAQILFTKAHILKEFPGFQHRDLHLDNIMIQLDPNYRLIDPEYKKPTESFGNKVDKNLHYYFYCLDDKILTFRVIRFMIKFGDFGFSDVLKLTRNALPKYFYKRKIVSIFKELNHYYDLHYFTSILITALREPQNKEKRSEEFLQFLETRVSPLLFRSLTTGDLVEQLEQPDFISLVVNYEFTTPSELLSEDNYLTRKLFRVNRQRDRVDFFSDKKYPPNILDIFGDLSKIELLGGKEVVEEKLLIEEKEKQSKVLEVARKKYYPSANNTLFEIELIVLQKLHELFTLRKEECKRNISKLSWKSNQSKLLPFSWIDFADQMNLYANNIANLIRESYLDVDVVKRPEINHIFKEIERKILSAHKIDKSVFIWVLDTQTKELDRKRKMEVISDTIKPIFNKLDFLQSKLLGSNSIFAENKEQNNNNNNNKQNKKSFTSKMRKERDEVNKTIQAIVKGIEVKGKNLFSFADFRLVKNDPNIYSTSTISVFYPSLFSDQQVVFDEQSDRMKKRLIGKYLEYIRKSTNRFGEHIHSTNILFNDDFKQALRVDNELYRKKNHVNFKEKKSQFNKYTNVQEGGLNNSGDETICIKIKLIVKDAVIRQITNEVPFILFNSSDTAQMIHLERAPLEICEQVGGEYSLSVEISKIQYNYKSFSQCIFLQRVYYPEESSLPILIQGDRASLYLKDQDIMNDRVIFNRICGSVREGARVDDLLITIDNHSILIPIFITSFDPFAILLKNPKENSKERDLFFGKNVRGGEHQSKNISQFIYKQSNSYDSSLANFTNSTKPKLKEELNEIVYEKKTFEILNDLVRDELKNSHLEYLNLKYLDSELPPTLIPLTKPLLTNFQKSIPGLKFSLTATVKRLESENDNGMEDIQYYKDSFLFIKTTQTDPNFLKDESYKIKNVKKGEIVIKGEKKERFFIEINIHHHYVVPVNAIAISSRYSYCCRLYDSVSTFLLPFYIERNGYDWILIEAYGAAKIIIPFVTIIE